MSRRPSFDCLGLRPIVCCGGKGETKQNDDVGTNLDNVNNSNIHASPSASVILLKKIGSLHSKDDDGDLRDDEGVIIVGRTQLLSAVLAACGCCDHQAVDDTKKEKEHKADTTAISTTIRPSSWSTQRCQHCRDTFHWASYALSRRLLRFQTIDDDTTQQWERLLLLQVRGQHARVSVNDVAIDVATDDDNDAWSHPPTKIKRGDVLRIQPRTSAATAAAGEGSGMDCRIEFQVVPVLLVSPPKEIVAAAGSKHIYETTQIHKPQLLQKDKLDATMILGKVDDTAKIDTDRSPSGTTKDDDDSNKIIEFPCGADDSVDDATEPPESKNVILEPPKLFFVPSSHDFYAHRRQVLQQKLEGLGVVFVPKLWDAQYIVISGSVRSLSVVAKLCKVRDSKLQTHLEQHKEVQCLLPSWADECIFSNQLLLPPGRKHVWPHFRAHASPKRKQAQDGNKETDDSSSKRQRPSSASSFRKPFPNNVQCAEVFKELSNLHQDMPLLDLDQWKSYCFRIVSGRLLHMDFEVDTDPATLQRLRGVKGFGKGVVDKIEEILNTGTVSRIQEFQHHPERVAMKNLTDIWGVGRVKAKDLMAFGYHDIHDIRTALKNGKGISKMNLDRNQLVGVDCYEDILDRMGRDEVETIKGVVEKTAQKVYPGAEVTIQGSYRRGKRTCGDVDIHITHRSFHEEIPDEALGQIMDILWDQGHIAYHLTVVNGMSKGMKVEDFERHSVFIPSSAWRSAKHRTHYTTEHNSFWMGCFYSPVKNTTRRRVDIKFYPYRERAFATVYFTGNGFLNRSMRLWAKRVFKWRLNDHGLFDLEDGLKRVMEASTEEEIFEKLKLIYKHPHERDSFDALEPKREALEEEGVLDEDMAMQLSEKEFQQEESGFVWVD